MVYQELPDEIAELIKAAKNPSNKKQIQDLSDKTDTEIIGVFLKEMSFRPYKRKPLHSIIAYDSYKKWNTNPTTMDYKQFIKSLRYWYAGFDLKDGVYFYTRYKGMRNNRKRVKTLLNEQKKQKTQGTKEEQQVS